MSGKATVESSGEAEEAQTLIRLYRIAERDGFDALCGALMESLYRRGYSPVFGYNCSGRSTLQYWAFGRGWPLG